MDFIVIGLVVFIVGSALAYIRKEKKKGVRCIGCPHAGSCAMRSKDGCSGSAEE